MKKILLWSIYTLFMTLIVFSCKEEKIEADLITEKSQLEQLREEWKAKLRSSPTQVNLRGGDDGDGDPGDDDGDEGDPETDFCSCHFQILDVTLTDAPPPNVRNVVEFAGGNQCNDIFCNSIPSFFFTSDGGCVPPIIDPNCVDVFTDLNEISNAWQDFNCSIPKNSNYNILFANYWQNNNCLSINPTTIGRMTIRLFCDDDLEQGCTEMYEDPEPFTLTVTGGQFDDLVNIQMGGDCGCYPFVN